MPSFTKKIRTSTPAPSVFLIRLMVGSVFLSEGIQKFLFADQLLPQLAVIGTAIATTKIPVFAHDGFWKTAHEIQVDFAMLLGLLFLLVVGAGGWSLDGRATKKAGSP